MKKKHKIYILLIFLSLYCSITFMHKDFFWKTTLGLFQKITYPMVIIISFLLTFGLFFFLYLISYIRCSKWTVAKYISISDRTELKRAPLQMHNLLEYNFKVKLPQYIFEDEDGNTHIIEYSKYTISKWGPGDNSYEKNVGDIPQEIIIKYNPKNPDSDWYVPIFQRKYKDKLKK